jgi:hypothetical protein
MKHPHPLYQFHEDYAPRPKMVTRRPPNWLLVFSCLLGVSFWTWFFHLVYVAFRGGR